MKSLCQGISLSDGEPFRRSLRESVVWLTPEIQLELTHLLEVDKVMATVGIAAGRLEVFRFVISTEASSYCTKEHCFLMWEIKLMISGAFCSDHYRLRVYYGLGEDKYASWEIF